MMIEVDPADKSKPTTAELIAELTRMKCVFQLRTIAAVMGASEYKQGHQGVKAVIGLHRP